MGNDSNSTRIAKNTIFLYLRSFIVLLISLYTSRVILKVLGIEDYGIYNVVGGIISGVSTVLFAGIWILESRKSKKEVVLVTESNEEETEGEN